MHSDNFLKSVIRQVFVMEAQSIFCDVIVKGKAIPVTDRGGP
jgi:hypothetical protein